MPNGYGKNWVRLCAAVEGFRSVHGSWPTEVHLPEVCYESIVELFRSESLEKVTSKLSFVIDGKPFVARDGEGRSYRYGEQDFPREHPGATAEEWLGVSPDVRFPDGM